MYRFCLVHGVGNVAPATIGTSGIGTLGGYLPQVDPNHFQGTVHWGPEKVISGAQVGQSPPNGAIAGFYTGSN